MLTLSGAYGRDYTSKKAVLADWNANKDFTIETLGVGGTYINKADAEADPTVGTVKIRFARMTKFVLVEIEGDL